MSFGKSLDGKGTINAVEETGASVQYEFRVKQLFFYFLKLHTTYCTFLYTWSKKSNQTVMFFVCLFVFMQITNLGRSLKYFTNASLNIFWPKENSVGKRLLYLTQTNSKGVQSVPCSPLNEINPLKDGKVVYASAFSWNCFTLNTSNQLLFEI